MPLYRWKGIDPRGTTHRGATTAETVEQLRLLLLEKNIALLSSTTRAEFFQKIIPQKRVSLDEITSFFEDLSVTLQGGIPLISALSLTQNYSPSKSLKKVVENITHMVQHGNTLSSAMEQHKDTFSAVMIQIVRAGEKSGNLNKALIHLTSYLKKRAELAQKLKNAAITPVITIVFALAIIVGLSVFVVPKLEPLLLDGNSYSTKFLLAINSTMGSEYARILISFGLIGLFLTLRSLKTTTLFAFKDRFVLQVPIIGKMVLYSNLAHFSQTLLLMLKTGAPIRPSLITAGKTCSNKVIANEIEQATLLIEKGEPIAKALEATTFSLFPDFFLATIALGEQADQLETMVEKCGTMIEKKLLKQINFVAAMFQPVLLIGVGIFVAFLLISLYAPLLDIANIESHL